MKRITAKRKNNGEKKDHEKEPDELKIESFNNWITE